MGRKGMAYTQGKAIPPAGLTQSLCPKLGSILCHSEAEPEAGSLETCSCSAAVAFHIESTVHHTQLQDRGVK